MATRGAESVKRQRHSGVGDPRAGGWPCALAAEGAARASGEGAASDFPRPSAPIPLLSSGHLWPQFPRHRKREETGCLGFGRSAQDLLSLAAAGRTGAVLLHGRLLKPVESSRSFCQKPFLAAPYPRHCLHSCGHLFAVVGPGAADQALPSGPGLLHRLYHPLQKPGCLRDPRLLLDLCGNLGFPFAQPSPLPGCLLPPAQRSRLGSSLSTLLPTVRLCLCLPAS